MKKWVLKDGEKNAKKSSELFDHYPENIARIFLNRGIDTKDGAQAFLDPQYEGGLHDPFLYSDMERAVGRILDAINNKEKMVIYGDYDCDGIPASVILHDFFKKVGFDNFFVYIPHRHNEGFGMNLGAMEEIARRGGDLIITVDNGITDIEAVDLANELGMEVIITDHHLPKEMLPKAYAIIDAKKPGDKYPFKELSGSGVAFKLVQALIKAGKFNIPEGWEKWSLDMAALGTIADMVPLVGENRVIAKYGLTVLKKTRRPGLQKLFRDAKIGQYGELSEEDIGFSIAPRINAASRMGEPIMAFNFLSSQDELESYKFLEYLEAKNTERKNSTESAIRTALKMMKKKEDQSVILLGHDEWGPGIVGLVAGRLSDEFNKTVFAWGRDGGGKIKGSCRSDGRVSVVELMESVGGKVFSAFGGHEMAGGFSIFEEKIDMAEKELNKAFNKIEKKETKGEDEFALDAILKIEDVTFNLLNTIQKMAPFGMGNRRPVFHLKDLEIYNIKKFGKTGGHLELGLMDGKNKISAYDFYINEDSFEGVKLALGKTIDLAGMIEKNNYGRAPSLRLKIVDIK